jgi:hypothetical protein
MQGIGRKKGLLREFPPSCTIHSLKAVVFALWHVRLFDLIFHEVLAT